MPNHFHGILVITDDGRTGGSRTAPTSHRKTLGQLLGAFKTTSMKWINLQRVTPVEKVCQRDYYEHTIRNEHTLNKIREYIFNNPSQWETDIYRRGGS
jgi:putative transposase